MTPPTDSPAPAVPAAGATGPLHQIAFRAVAEAAPGPAFAAMFDDYWPAFAAWWKREGLSARPTYRESREALRRHMPEIVGLYDEVVDVVGGGDSRARFLSFYCPPAYLAGCSQAIWPGEAPLLVRNYDYAPDAFDAVILRSEWQGRGVIGLTDGLFGLVDGMNADGLVASLTFGGRREMGVGFGVPLILRYVLQTCATAKEAIAALVRLPCHMSYNVTVLDADRDYATVYLAPDREAVVRRTPVATNHQEQVEWSSHARFTATVERERFLLQRLTLHEEPQDKFVGAFLRPPLYSTAFAKGFGTLYTAAYRPREGALEVRWPDRRLSLSFDDFTETTQWIGIPADA